MTHEERVWHHEMETMEGIHEHAERIASLEELVEQTVAQITETCDVCDGDYCTNFDEDNECCVYVSRARELGIEP